MNNKTKSITKHTYTYIIIISYHIVFSKFSRDENVKTVCMNRQLFGLELLNVILRVHLCKIEASVPTE